MNIEKIKAEYPAGTKVRLINMNDIQAPPAGTTGTVVFVDDIGSIHVNWETGSTLALIPEVDRFAKIKGGDQLEY